MPTATNATTINRFRHERITAARRRQLEQIIDQSFEDSVGDTLTRADWRWIASAGSRVVAAVAVRRIAVATNTGGTIRVGHLTYLVTDREHRGKGLGGQLLERVKHDAKALGLRIIVLHAAVAAIGLYQRHGWQIVAPRTSYMVPPIGDDDPTLAWAADGDVSMLTTSHFVLPEDW